MNDRLIHERIEGILPEEAVRFCVPGHRGTNRLLKNVNKRILRYDITELNGCDNLQVPLGILKDAQDRAAKIFGAAQTFFSVNGSTACIVASILSVCRPKDKIIIDRNCHVSVVNGLILSGAVPIFVEREKINEFDINGGIDPENIREAINSNSGVKGILVTSPNYYGICLNLQRIIEIAHEKDVLVIVDEAHGSHLTFSSSLPMSAIECGADIVVNSVHKTLPCVTQGALLHLNTNRVNHLLIKDTLNMLQTTSPSYLIMSSLDSACAVMQDRGQSILNNLVETCNKFVDKLNGINGIKCLNKDIIGKNSVFDIDNTRLVFNFNRTSMTSDECEEILRKKFNIYIEMCDRSNIISIATIDNSAKDINYFRKSMINILKNVKELRGDIASRELKTGKILLSPRDAFYMDKEIIDTQDAEGKIAAKPVYNVPPGSIILCPGEQITSETIDCMINEYHVAKIWINS